MALPPSVMMFCINSSLSGFSVPPNTVLVEDALSLSLLVAERNHFRGIAPIRFRIVRSEKRIGLCGFGVFETTSCIEEGRGRESNDNRITDSHRPAPTAEFCD